MGQGDDESAGRGGIDRGDGSLIQRTRIGPLLLMSLLEEFAHLALPRFDDVVECRILQPGAHRQNLWRNRHGLFHHGWLLLRRDDDGNPQFFRRATGRPSGGLVEFDQFALATLLLLELLSLKLLFQLGPRRLGRRGRARMRRASCDPIRL